MKRNLALTLAMSMFVGSSLAAHDMWIEPTAFAPAVGSIVGLRLRVGEHFIGDPIPRDPPLIHEFVSVDQASRTPVAGRDGADPAGLIKVAVPGLIIAGYHSRPSAVTLTADKFNQYLKEEGLDRIASTRAARGEANAQARELFSRFAKSLVMAGSSRAGGDRALGFTLELIAERNPYSMAIGGALPVQLVHEGRPLAGVQVVAMNRTNPSERQIARTDKNGRVSLQLTREGPWLVKAVHMLPAPGNSGADWISYWASLTFELGRS
jgi:uncharacterized GH25 family protein